MHACCQGYGWGIPSILRVRQHTNMVYPSIQEGYLSLKELGWCIKKPTPQIKGVRILFGGDADLWSRMCRMCKILSEFYLEAKVFRGINTRPYGVRDHQIDYKPARQLISSSRSREQSNQYSSVLFFSTVIFVVIFIIRYKLDYEYYLTRACKGAFLERELATHATEHLFVFLSVPGARTGAILVCRISVRFNWAFGPLN